MPDPTPKPILPRLVLEQAADGTLSAEYYINGARSRVALPFGYEAAELRAIFAELRASIAAEAERRIARQEAEERARHSRVYWHSVNAAGQGRAFADRVIGRPTANAEPKGPKPLVADASFV